MTNLNPKIGTPPLITAKPKFLAMKLQNKCRRQSTRIHLEHDRHLDISPGLFRIRITYQFRIMTKQKLQSLSRRHHSKPISVGTSGWRWWKCDLEEGGMIPFDVLRGLRRTQSDARSHTFLNYEDAMWSHSRFLARRCKPCFLEVWANRYGHRPTRSIYCSRLAAH